MPETKKLQAVALPDRWAPLLRRVRPGLYVADHGPLHLTIRNVEESNKSSLGTMVMEIHEGVGPWAAGLSYTTGGLSCRPVADPCASYSGAHSAKEAVVMVETMLNKAGLVKRRKKR